MLQSAPSLVMTGHITVVGSTIYVKRSRMAKQISRRQVLRSAAAATVGVAFADLLTACGGPAAPPPAAQATIAPTAAAVVSEAATSAPAAAATTAPAANSMVNALGLTLPADALPLDQQVQ